jgi:hypothetical protein
MILLIIVQIAVLAVLIPIATVTFLTLFLPLVLVLFAVCPEMRTEVAEKLHSGYTTISKRVKGLVTLNNGDHYSGRFVPLPFISIKI